MRAVAQRVREAAVRVGGEEIARMREGLLVLVGVAVDDTPEDAEELARKLVGLRVFPDADGRMNRSLLDTGGTLGVGVAVHLVRRRAPGSAALVHGARPRPNAPRR
jgi:D-tyrosyl-tRNA(Tyr) deacylase